MLAGFARGADAYSALIVCVSPLSFYVVSFLFSYVSCVQCCFSCVVVLVSVVLACRVFVMYMIRVSVSCSFLCSCFLSDACSLLDSLSISFSCLCVLFMLSVHCSWLLV